MLTEHFSELELTESDTATRLGIDNTPSQSVLENLMKTAIGMELVRKYLGDLPIRISSGYRSPALNAAVGGSMGSSHLLGQAVDFTCPAFGTPEQVVAALSASDIEFDQCIWEFSRWVHISFTDKKRRQVLTIDRRGTRSFA